MLHPTYGQRALTIHAADRCHLIDDGGRRYLDFITGIGVNALGHGHPAIVAAITEQAGRCIHTSNLHAHPYQTELAARLVEWSGLAQVFFSNSGTEAMEAALKAARALANGRGRERHRVVALENGFHGRTAGSLAVTGQPKYREPFQPLAADVVFVPANDMAALAAAVTPETIAIVAETIQGEGGIHPLTPEFLGEIRRLAGAAGALWIADETQCGLGRTGHRFAFQAFPDLAPPDVIVTAKPLAGGLPLGATIFNAVAAEAIGPGMHGTTFGGGPLACRAALAFLPEVDRLLPQIRANGEYLQQRLRALRSPLIREVRGRGLMAGIELTCPGDVFVARALALDVVINCTHGNVLRLLPPYIAGRAEIDQAVETLAFVLG